MGKEGSIYGPDNPYSIKTARWRRHLNIVAKIFNAWAKDHDGIFISYSETPSSVLIWNRDDVNFALELQSNQEDLSFSVNSSVYSSDKDGIKRSFVLDKDSYQISSSPMFRQNLTIAFLRLEVAAKVLPTVWSGRVIVEDCGVRGTVTETSLFVLK